jgi:dihydrofolate reductase
MRRITESTLLSLDGVFEDPHIWATEYFDQEAEQYALDLLLQADAMLMGRRTYEFFAAAFPHRAGEYGARVNRIHKYVFSNTLTKADWSNSTIVKGDIAAGVKALKEADGKDLVVYGHGLFATTLLQKGLIDEVKLWIHPLLLGHPQRSAQSRNKLTLAGTRVLKSGVIVATYHPS